MEGEIELQNKVIESINSEEHKPLEELNLISKNGIIFNNEIKFITIRSWGNLTGVGAHNLSSERAAEIQDNFQNWLIYKLTS